MAVRGEHGATPRPCDQVETVSIRFATWAVSRQEQLRREIRELQSQLRDMSTDDLPQELATTVLRNGFNITPMFGIGRIMPDVPASIEHPPAANPNPQFFDVSQVFRPADRVAFQRQPIEVPRTVEHHTESILTRAFRATHTVALLRRHNTELALRYMPGGPVLVNRQTMQDIQAWGNQDPQPPQGGELCPQSSDGHSDA